jgi:hypothetical protein
LQLSGTNHTIIAVYSGASSFKTSQGNTTQTVNKANTQTTDVTSTNSSSVYGQTITLSATVSAVTSGIGIPTGTINFMEGATLLGPGSVDNSTGKATLTLPNTSPVLPALNFGNHTITAIYQGDSSFNLSPSPNPQFVQSISQASTSTQVKSTNTSAAYGVPVITAVVSNTTSGSTGTPTGTVTFTVTGSSSFTEQDSLVGGTATLQKVLAPGSYTIKATYNHDDVNNNFSGSSDTTGVSQTITKASSSVALTPLSANPVTGQSVLLTATVTNTSSTSTGVPQGTVQFFDGATEIGTDQTLATVSGKQQASVTWVPTTATTHSLTIKYISVGDDGTTTNPNFSNTQTPVSQAVDPDGTLTQVSFSPPHPVAGDSVTINVTVLAGPPGSGTPTGSVIFNFDSAQTTKTLIGGQTSLVVSNLSQSTHSITVSYLGNSVPAASGGDPNYTPSSSGSTLSVLTRNQGFVAQLYRDLLGREAALTEINGWSAQLDLHDQNPAGGLSRTQLAGLFVNTYEFRADEVDALYVKYLHRHADPAGLAGWVNYLLAGNTVEQLASLLVGSVEFFITQGGGTNSGFLNAMYMNALNRPVDSSGLSSWLPLLNAGVQRGSIAYAIIDSTEGLDIVVGGFYQKFLHRTPDPAGLAGWVTAIQRGPLHVGLTDEQVIAAFIGSDEYSNDL